MGNDQEKLNKYLKKYHLEELTNQSDIDSVNKIGLENLGTGLMEAGLSLSNLFRTAKDEEMLQIYYLRTIMEQNFIMIRQLERISKAVGGEPEPKKATKMEQYLKAKQESVRRNT